MLKIYELWFSSDAHQSWIVSPARSYSKKNNCLATQPARPFEIPWCLGLSKVSWDLRMELVDMLVCRNRSQGGLLPGDRLLLMLGPWRFLKYLQILLVDGCCVVVCKEKLHSLWFVYADSLVRMLRFSCVALEGNCTSLCDVQVTLKTLEVCRIFVCFRLKGPIPSVLWRWL